MRTLTPLSGPRRIRRILAVTSSAVALGAAVAALQLTTGASGSSAVATPPAQEALTSGFVDKSSNDYFRIELDGTKADYGHFAVAIPGVGLGWAGGAATITTRSATSTTLRYDGPGYLDPEAALDTEFGVGYKPQGDIADATIKLRGQVDARHGTGTIEVWVDGRHYHLAAAPTAQGADPVAARLTTALATQDWHTVYALADDTLRGDMPESEFVSWIQGQLGSGTVDDVSITGTTTYFTTRAGISYAKVPVHEAVTVAGQSQSVDATLILIYDRGSWRWLTTK